MKFTSRLFASFEFVITGLLSLSILVSLIGDPVRALSKFDAIAQAKRLSTSMRAIPDTDDLIFFDNASSSFRSKSIEDPNIGRATEFAEINGDVFKVEASPDRRKLAVESSIGKLGEENEVWILDLTTRAQPVKTRLVSSGNGRLIGWHPDSEHVLYVPDRNGLDDWGLWLVNIQDGSHKRLDTPTISAPEMIVSAAYRPTNDDLAIVISEGIGHGSSVWLYAADGKSEKIWQGDQAIASDLTWSPDGASLAFINLEDSAVPFTAAELIVYDSISGAIRPLALTDGGHGQKPAWDPAGKAIYFVYRTNLDSEDANRESGKLQSSIRKVNIDDGKLIAVVESNGRKNVDIVIDTAGNVVFSSSGRDGQGSIEYAGGDGSRRTVAQMTKDVRFPVLLTETSK
jgi:Tol biopolymer transport system component